MAIITLTSDIGTKDYLAGAVKGRLLSVNPTFTIADISHSISPFNYNEAVYIVKNSFHVFPEHSWHLLMVNMFDNVSPYIVIAWHKGHYFACADNGLLPMIFGEMPEHTLLLPFGGEDTGNVLSWVHKVGNAIQKMEQGASFLSLGAEAEEIVAKYNLKPVSGDDYLEGRIIFIDNFENVVVNITRDLFDAVCKGRRFKIEFKGDESITRLSKTYSDVAEGSTLAFFNTAGYLEIAVNKGNAAGLFGLQQFNSQLSSTISQSKIFYQTVKVFFQ